MIILSMGILMNNPFDINKVRADFPMMKKKMNEKPLIYLDTAATAQKPQVVIDAMTYFYSESYGTVHRAVYELAAQSTEMYGNVRSKVRNFINAKEDSEIIFTRGTTESINLIASSFGKAFIQEGDEVILSVMEHHSNLVPWQQMCIERKAHLKVIPINEKGDLLLDAYEQLLSDKTKIVSISHISNVTGTLNPIKEIVDKAHKKGAKVFVDGAQAAPHLPLDVQDLDVDFYAFSGHKLYGPTGIGILYGKKSLLDAIPPFLFGGDMIEEVTFEKTTFQSSPLKFEAGTPSIAAVIGLGSAIDYLQSIGRHAIHEWEQKIFHYAIEKITEIKGLHLFGTAKERGAILSFTIQGIHSLDIVTILVLKGVAIR